MKLEFKTIGWFKTWYIYVHFTSKTYRKKSQDINWDENAAVRLATAFIIQILMKCLVLFGLVWPVIWVQQVIFLYILVQLLELCVFESQSSHT